MTSHKHQVVAVMPSDPSAPLAPSGHRLQWSSLLIWLYHWLIWSFLTVLVCSQLLAVVWDSTSTKVYLLYGQSPLASGKHMIDGTNDEPYTDRSLVCVRQGRLYRPKNLIDLLPDAHIVGNSSALINGYRVIERNVTRLDPVTEKHYIATCELLATTLDGILDSCKALGYPNVTVDHLRVVDGLESSVMKLIPESLPILLLPFWDNAIFGRYVVPSYDGMACLFLLIGKYESEAQPEARLGGASRSVREQKTLEFLGLESGRWRNGWLEANDGQTKWHADVQTSNYDPTYQFQMPQRQFDTIANQELDCLGNSSACKPLPVIEGWGKQIRVIDTVLWHTLIAISNGLRYGLFMYESIHLRTIQCVYDLETFLSNCSILLLLMRWMAVMLAAQNGFRRQWTQWHACGIGSALGATQSFSLLPIVLLPRLKMTLAAFWTLGIQFEGEQKSLSEAWFVIYPAIAEFMLCYYSLLNSMARLCRRRISDALFGPTLLLLSLLHLLRRELSQSGVYGIDGRVQTLVLSTEFQALRLSDFITQSDLAWRMNGQSMTLFVLKSIILAVNLLIPLMFMADDTSVQRIRKQSIRLSRIEELLAVRASAVGGLGRLHCPNQTELSGFEVLRLGYVVFGDRYLLQIQDWCLLWLLTPLRLLPSRHTNIGIRFFVFSIDTSVDGQKMVRERPQLMRWNDARLQSIGIFAIASCPLP